MMRRTSRWILLAAALAGVFFAFSGRNAPAAATDRWLVVNYGPLLERRRLTHSGEPVGALLQRLGGRPMPTGSDRPEDLLAYRLLGPVLEPYAFVLPDALDATAPPPDPPMVEVGGLWEPGSPQPAWVELARARRLLLESDGAGHVRAFLPSPSLDAVGSLEGAAPVDPAAAAEAAWTSSWPVLRHAIAAERRRLAKARPGGSPAIDVEVHAYRHLLAQSKFLLGVVPWRTTVTDTGPPEGTRTLDLHSLQAALDRGLQVEGARIDGAGRLRLLLGDADGSPTLLGRPVALSDVAVAYRAVSRGGVGEPYMSLDRAGAPHVADVNYGGRLRDTALGMVSLLSDVRFKTFSLGIDLIADADLREAIRAGSPEFRTHLERFAADPTAGAVLNQQTRFWFYPDGVDLTVSAEGDVLAFRKVRMSAASERVRAAGETAADPPWTKATVAFLNAHYDELAARFPEMADLDESVRWLSIFTWLEAARARGLPVPDLDALLALELPSVPTARRFPQLLSYDVLPPAGSPGAVDVFDRTVVGTALDALEPADGRPLPAARRFRRALAQLDRRAPDQASLAKEMDAVPTGTDAIELDLLSYRAERLLMHTRVLASLPADRSTAVESRRAAAPETRVFSIGIGGVDLGTGAIVARASGRASKLSLTGTTATAMPSQSVPVRGGTELVAGRAVDPAELPASVWPDHGLGPDAERHTATVGEGQGSIVSRSRPGSLVRKGQWKVADGHAAGWQEWIEGLEGTEVRSRRRIADPGGAAPVFERVEEGRFLTYRFDRQGGAMTAALAVSQLPDTAFGSTAGPVTPDATVPSGLTLINLMAAGAGPAVEADETATLGIRVRETGGRDRSASVPRALLQRVVLGPEVDPTPGRPLAAFMPAAQILGTARIAMLLQPPASARAPWDRPEAAPPGEEDAARLASGLTRWWSTDPASKEFRAIVGVDAASPQRWFRAPSLEGGVGWVSPDDAFPEGAAALREALAAHPASTSGARLIVVASAEPPGVLGRRLRALASDPANDGKLLAVASFGGPLRRDLAASLLAEGHLAGLGVVASGPVGRAKAAEELLAWARAATSPPAKGRRAEALPGPFTWFY